MQAFNYFRIIPRDADFLDRKTGSRGEVFFDEDSNSLRLYDGISTGGISLLRADLENIEGVIGAALGDTPPEGVDPGTIWFNTATGKIFIYYNDGNSSQWVQPTSLVYGGGGGGGGGGATSLNDLTNVSITSPTTGQVLKYNGSIWVNGTDNSSAGGGGGDVSGPASSTDNAIARFNLATGKLIQTSPVTIGDDGAITAPAAGSVIPFYYANQGGFPNASTYHGAIAHSHADGKMYFAHAGEWVALANASDVPVIGGINSLTDVDTSTTPPTAGQVLKWNGTNWVPASDVASGGGGTDADTLDGLDSTYYLNFTNLSNKPNIFNTIAVTGQSSVIADTANDTLTLTGSGGVSITTNSTTDSITISSVTYGISAETATGGVNLRLTGSNSSTDDVKLAAGSNVTLTRTDANTITISASASGGSASNSFETISVAGQSNVVADSSTDTLTLVAGTGITITTDASSDSITITNSASGASAFGTVAVAGQSNVVADSTNDTITLVAGTGISITTDSSSDTVTITNTVSAGATAFTGLSDVSTASLTIDKIYLPAISMLTVTNNGAVAYRFDQYGTTDDPTIYAINGTTIAFNLNVTGHPFLIQDSGGTNYNTGLVHVATNGTVATGSSAQGQTQGTLYWKIPSSISGNYRYQCGAHAGMVGTIVVKDFSTL